MGTTIVTRIKTDYMKKTLFQLASTTMLFVSVIAFYGCKDYKKLAAEFEANLPDSLVFLMAYDNPEEDMHLVYYKNIDNEGYECTHELYKYNLATSSVDTIRFNNMIDDSESCGLRILCDTKHIVVLEQISGGDYFELFAYNPKNDKLKKFGQGTAIEMPNDSILSCVETEEDSRYIVTTHTTYDYKGKRINSKTEREIKPEEIYVWQCKWCDKIVNSSQKPGDAPGSCIKSKRTTIGGILYSDYLLHEYDGNRHKWINIGRAR